MIIGALKTTSPTDKRSVLHPETISRLVNLEGVKVIFESGIGQGINVSDSEFQKNNLTPVNAEIFSIYVIGLHCPDII